jgi:mRNA-degrading endonuclease RelE of RelBE toxin-antitoxin system
VNRFRIADTFTGSLAKLTGDEQKAVKTTAFDLQLNPASPGMQFHRLDRAKDRNFWSVRVNRDIRLIVHRTQGSLLLCYVAHHDDAYDWAERRKLETHPTTGAAQLIEVRELVREVPVTKYVAAAAAEPAQQLPLFAHISDESLLGYGVPVEWLPDVRAATDATVLDVADHLPAEAAEAVLALAIGETPQAPEPVPAGTSPFEHPDAQRRFRVVTDVDELERALEYPWDRWMVFLHPAQRQTVERSFSGPARVSGSAGTGKTIVALHRAVHLARSNEDARVLLTTFSDPLANALRGKLRRLIRSEPRLAERLEVHALDAIAARLHERIFGRRTVVTHDVMRDLLVESATIAGEYRSSPHFLLTEWEEVVDAWQLESWEAYRSVARLGRRTRLPEKTREALWPVFELTWKALRERRMVTLAGMYSALATHLAESRHVPFDHVVVDEAQDLSVPQLRFLAALAADRPDGLFLAGDLGQRIFQQPFSWKSLGVDIRGRATILRINYRTSHQIRARADRLLGPEIADVDGNVESRRGTVSVFNGPAPEVRVLASPDEEVGSVAGWLRERIAEGIGPHEIGVFVRSPAELERATAALDAAGVPHRVLDERIETASGHASVSTMHLAKGLEFRTVVVMACDDDVIPSQERIGAVTDEGDLEEVYNTERHLLYVACTRARDHLLVTSGGVASEFLDDLGSA